MSIINKDQLSSQTTSSIPDNTTEKIRAVDVRSLFQNVVDSSINAIDDATKLNLRDYDPSRGLYAVGEAAIYNDGSSGDIIYKCIVATQGTFNSVKWNAISSPSSSGVATDLLFTDLTPSNIAIGADPAGSTYTDFSVIDYIKKIRHAYIAPQIYAFGNNINQLVFGQAGGAVTLSCVVMKETNNITSMSIDQGVGNVGTVPITSGSQSFNVASAFMTNVNKTWTFSISDGSGTSNAQTNITYYLERYWGSIDQIASITDAMILALDGADVGSGKEMTTGRQKNYNGINGNGNYLIFAWSSSYGDPSFQLDGLTNTAYTKVRSNSSFTNEYGYTYNIDVWVSNTKYNAPVNVFQIN